MDSSDSDSLIGPLRVTKVAHGGHWVSRTEDGRVVFLRGALEGELVRARITATAKRHAFADVIEVLEASPDRVLTPCGIADRCGGCDFQHVRPAAQLELKRQVVAEQLGRLAGLAWTGQVEAVPPVERWRTRVRYHFDGEAWGMHPARSHAVTPLPEAGCLIAAEELLAPPVAASAGGSIVGVASADGVRWFSNETNDTVLEQAAGRTWRVAADGFWQVHPAAADTLVDAVLTGLAPRAGESAFDLYCGVGLFAGALVDRGVSVVGVEGSKTAVGHARTNVPEASFLAGSVDKALRRLPRAVDLVVLDPPRVGAGASVLGEILGRRPRAVAYVACDPASLARDLGLALAAGWRVDSLRAFDLFPMTHHVECVAILQPRD